MGTIKTEKKATLKTDTGVLISEIIGLKTIKGIRERAGKILTERNMKGCFFIEIQDGHEVYSQKLQII